jgi:hypothetical protein
MAHDDLAQSLKAAAVLARDAEREADRYAALSHARLQEIGRLERAGDAGAQVSRRLHQIAQRQATFAREVADALRRVAEGKEPYGATA